jgi:non-specific serine/threonine protein kinase
LTPLSSQANRAPRDRWRAFKRRFMRRLADRATRRHLLLVLVTLLALGLLAAVKGIIGYYLFATKATRIEVALAVVAVIAAAFAFGERKLASALEARFNRNTKKHREALARLRDELAEAADRKTLERDLVARFDELFATHGTALYLDNGDAFAVVAHSGALPNALPYEDPLIESLRARHAPVASQDVGSTLTAPLVWPLRVRGHLVGLLAAGEHDYLESFEPSEVEAVEVLADTAAATLALLDPALTAHLVHTPNNLAPALSAFVGRAREIEEGRAILAHHRLLTLTGFGGTGKTRLAQELAREALPTYRSGVWWVELADVNDPAHVNSTVAAAVGLPENAGTVVTPSSLARHFGEGAVLLVLDTCEHVRHACASLAADLLRECPRLALLATSQSPLGVSGERDYPVSALPLPAADADPQALAENDAVRLFVDRACAVAPQFAPGPAELADIAAIVRELDGIPLAIELAAARVKLLSLSAIRAHLAESMRLLTGGDHAVARHETMRASLAWSYDPLDAADQALLRKLSLFANGFTLEAAAFVAAGANDPLTILDSVTRLVDASLLHVVRIDGEEPRYRMPETLRQFAQELLARDPDVREIRERHARFYVDLAQRETAALHRREMAQALARLDRELPNLVAAHAWLVQAGDGEAALSLAHAMTPYWRDRGSLARGRQLTREALQHASAASRLRAAVLLDAADLDACCGDVKAATAHLTEALRLAQSLAADDLACRALSRMALALQRAGDASGARRSLEEAKRVALRVEDASARRAVQDDIGEHARNEGAWDDAQAAADKSLALAREADDVPALHAALREGARIAAERRDLARARTLLREAVDIALASHAELDGENDLEVAGELAAAAQDWPRAARYAGAADAAAAAMGSARTMRDDATTIADLAAPRAALGEVAYTVAYEAGRRLKLASALAEARNWLASEDGAPMLLAYSAVAPARTPAS